MLCWAGLELNVSRVEILLPLLCSVTTGARNAGGSLTAHLFIRWLLNYSYICSLTHLLKEGVYPWQQGR